VFDINASSPTTSNLLLPCVSVPYGLDPAASVKSLDSGGKPGGIRAEDSSAYVHARTASRHWHLHLQCKWLHLHG